MPQLHQHDNWRRIPHHCCHSTTALLSPNLPSSVSRDNQARLGRCESDQRRHSACKSLAASRSKAGSGHAGPRARRVVPDGAAVSGRYFELGRSFVSLANRVCACDGVLECESALG